MPIAPVPTEAPQRRPRFSLLNLLLLMTIVVMGIVIRRLAPLREENVRLRNEARLLPPGNDGRIKAIELQGRPNVVWAYRVYLPPGRNYAIAVKWNDLPSAGTPSFAQFPSSNMSVSLGGNSVGCGLTDGEKLISLKKFTLPNGDHEYSLELRDSDGRNSWTLSGKIRASDNQWPMSDTGSLMHLSGIVGRRAIDADPSKKLILLDERLVRPESQPNGSRVYQMSDPPPADGVMLWIESR